MQLDGLNRDQLKAHLAALIEERAKCEATIKAAELATIRLSELNNGWRALGEIAVAELAVRDCEFPIFEKPAYRTKRIIAVDGKWITIREDRCKDETQYHLSTGQEKGTRSGLRTIDAAKALAIWNQRNANQGESDR
jgi:hypothetical protein